jgi:hypothetical protein
MSRRLQCYGYLTISVLPDPLNSALEHSCGILVTLEAIGAGVIGRGEIDPPAHAHIAEASELMRLVIVHIRLAAPSSAVSREATS